METVLPELDLGDHCERFIARQIAEGRFATASEVVRAALALLEERERQRAEDYERLVGEIRAALDDPGPPVPAATVFDRIERELEEEIRREAKGRVRAEGA